MRISDWSSDVCSSDLDHRPGDIELPAVENAAQRAVLVSRQYERNAPMRAGLVEEADSSISGPKGDVIAAKQPDPRGSAIRLEAGAARTGNPVLLTHHPAHRRVAFDIGQETVLFLGQHGLLLRFLAIISTPDAQTLRCERRLSNRYLRLSA